MRRHLGVAALVLTIALTACSTGGSTPGSTSTASGQPAKSDVTISYSLWDPNQQPTYQKCASDFTAKTGIKIDIRQQGWDDYWTGITTDLVTGNAPDVITNHVAYYPQLAASNQLVDPDPYLDKDPVDFTQYTGDLASLWVKDGKRYGIPQDWDTIAMVYNTANIEAAGYKAEDLKSLTWNPADGGTFGKFIAHLTIDKNGVRGDEPGFDKTQVETYGWGLEPGGGVVGQGQWSWMALGNGFEYLDKNPFGTHYNLDSPKLIETFEWWQKQFEAGYVIPPEQAGALGLQPMMEQNKASFVTDGSWRINTWSQSTAQKFAFAPLPAGPQGAKTIINGLAPSITTSSKHPDEAWQWVKYLTSADCQKVVASDAVVFPPSRSSRRRPPRPTPTRALTSRRSATSRRTPAPSSTTPSPTRRTRSTPRPALWSTSFRHSRRSQPTHSRPWPRRSTSS